MTTTIIGIDLGTSNSTAGAVVGGIVQLFPSSDRGRRSIPSVVAFTNDQRLTGQDAADQFVQNPQNTIYSISRLIGRRCTDTWLVKNFRKFPFPVVSYEGRVIVKVMYKDQPRYFRPEQLLALLLMKLKEISEEKLEGQVSRAVIAVPACFNSHQRLATINAAKIAGLTVERLISAPAAVALAYRAEMGIQREQKLLIFIMGGGSCDISLINVVDTNFTVLATAGSAQLGGVELDDTLVEHFMCELKTKHSFDIRENPKVMQELRRACVKAKTILSVKPRAHILLQGLPDGIKFPGRISREEFEEMNSKFFTEISALLDTVLSDSSIEPDEIDDIVLAGGSTWIPRVQDLLSQYFKHKTLNKILSPEEAVCIGTCIYASTLDENKTSNSTIRGLSNVTLTEVNPLPLKILVKGDLVSNLIPRNAILPTDLHKEYTTSKDGQDSLAISIIQSDNEQDCAENIFLSGISAAPAGLPKIDVVFKIDVNGILRLKVCEYVGHKKFPLEIISDFYDLKLSEIANIISDMEKLKLEDEKNRENIVAREALRSYIMEKQQNVINGTPSKAKHLLFHDKCVEALQWIEENPAVEKLRYEQKRAELDVFLQIMESDA